MLNLSFVISTSAVNPDPVSVAVNVCDAWYSTYPREL
jgi:hypothetical protein